MYYIKQAAKGLNSRSEAEIKNQNETEFKYKLPLIAAPMYSIYGTESLSADNFKTVAEMEINGIINCTPRGMVPHPNGFLSVSISELKELFKKDSNSVHKYICVDVANGNIPMLHEAIREFKRKHHKCIVMSGNVSSVEAFNKLADAGCDFIRVGIGGGGNCTTTVHTGVGQSDLYQLVKDCRKQDRYVKIVADGISSFSRLIGDDSWGQYRSINLLLYAGADYVMLGSAFARAYDTCGEYYTKHMGEKEVASKDMLKTLVEDNISVFKQTSGMSTRESQQNYSTQKRHSEGITKEIQVRYSIEEWVHGVNEKSHREEQLPGFVNVLRSAMSYNGARTLKEFKDNS